MARRNLIHGKGIYTPNSSLCLSNLQRSKDPIHLLGELMHALAYEYLKEPTHSPTCTHADVNKGSVAGKVVHGGIHQH
jgi:hypothetical protein